MFDLNQAAKLIQARWKGKLARQLFLDRKRIKAIGGSWADRERLGYGMG